MRPTRLEAPQLEQALSTLPDWQRVEGRDAIHRQFTFTDFNEAFAFMTRVALMAEKLDHHPEWSNVYQRVDVLLSTHSAGGVTTLDLQLARFCDQAAAQLAVKAASKAAGT